MRFWPEASSTEARSFSSYLDQAALADRQGHLVIPPQHRNQTLRTPASPLISAWVSGWRWLKQTRTSRSAARRLRVTETVSLGEKRFVSILQVDDAQFLIGCSASSVHLLAHLHPRSEGTVPGDVTTQEQK